MVLAAAGGVDHQKLVDLGKQYFGDLDGVDENFVAESGKFIASYVRYFGFFRFQSLFSFVKFISLHIQFTHNLKHKYQFIHLSLIIHSHSVLDVCFSPNILVMGRNEGANGKTKPYS